MKRFSPLRIVIDTSLRTPPSSHLAKTARLNPTWIFTNKPHNASRAKSLEKKGIHIISFANGKKAKKTKKVSLEMVMKKIAEKGITRVLVEGGSKIITSLIRSQLVDNLILYRSTKIIGSNGLTVMGNLKVPQLLNAIHFNRISVRETEGDVMESYERSS